MSVDRKYGVIEELGMKAPVLVATTGANITLSGLQTIDGVVLVDGNRVLVKDQTDQTTNGIYVVHVSAWTRDLDFDGPFDIVSGTLVPVGEAGSLNKGTLWQVSTLDPISIDGSTPSNITFTQILTTTVTAITASTLKNPPVDADWVVIVDSVSGAINRITWANIRAALAALTNTWGISITGSSSSAATVTSSLSNGVTATTQTAGDNSTKVATDAFVQAAMQGQYLDEKLQSVSSSVSSNALTVGLNPTTLDFRSTTLTTGSPTTLSNSALSLTIPAGATLGTVNAIQARLFILAINNVGTMELAIVNQAGALNLDESGLISTTAISGTSNSNNVIYSANARTNVAYRVVGYIEITEATAGTWVTAPSLVQGAGGQAGASLQSSGNGQTYQNMTGSRALATPYYNQTTKDIKVSFWGNNNTQNGYVQATMDGAACVTSAGACVAGGVIALYFDVRPGASYSIAAGNGTMTAWTWYEMR